MKTVLALVFAAFFTLGAQQAMAERPKVLVIGDSLLATHSLTGRSVADYLSSYLGAPVTDRSAIGAMMIYRLPITGALGMSIPAQYRDGDWDWVVVNGAGNDLWLTCGCGPCRRKMDRLISPSGTAGEIPKLLARIHRTGARIVYVGYMRSPDIATPIERCKTVGDTLERRVATLADKVPNIHYLSLENMIPPGDLSYLAPDRIHPSPKASRAIAERIARLIVYGQGA